MNTLFVSSICPFHLLSEATVISILAANPKIAGEFYAINNHGIFCSIDSGNSWKMLDGITWPKDYLSQHPKALAVQDGTLITAKFGATTKLTISSYVFILNEFGHLDKQTKLMLLYLLKLRLCSRKMVIAKTRCLVYT